MILNRKSAVLLLLNGHVLFLFCRGSGKDVSCKVSLNLAPVVSEKFVQAIVDVQTDRQTNNRQSQLQKLTQRK